MGEHIPNFKDRDEEARFWQKTGVDQLSPDEYEEVEVERPQRPLSATFAVRFDPRTIEHLRQVARAQNLGATQLVRAWVLERLKIEKVVGLLAETSGEFPNEIELVVRTKILKALMDKVPAAAEAAMQEVFDRIDQESKEFRESLQ